MYRRFVLRSWLLAAALMAPRLARGVDVADFIDFSLRGTSGQVLLPGRLYVPPEAAADPSTPRPLMVFLHGGGSDGTDNLTQLSGTPDFMLDEAKARGAFLYVPQTANNWSSLTLVDRVMTMVERAVTDEHADASRLYMTGYSNGGGGTWNILSRYPHQFAAAVAVSGVNPAAGFVAANLVGTPIFALHARDDATASVTNTRTVVSGILAASHDQVPRYPVGGSPLNLLVSNPQFAIERPLSDLLHTIPDITISDFLLSVPTNDLLYFESNAGGHTGLLGVFYTPETYDWLFAHPLAAPEPATLVTAAAGLIEAALLMRRSSGASKATGRGRVQSATTRAMANPS